MTSHTSALASRRPASAAFAPLIALLAAVAPITGCGGGKDSGVTEPPAGQPPRITVDPVPSTAPVGGSATFAVVAAGDEPFIYQWERNRSAIAGATERTYTISAVTAADSGASFRVEVSNAAGSATSDEALLSVIRPSEPEIGPPISGPPISANGHVLVILPDSSVVAWGDDAAGQLGIFTDGTARPAPAPVPGLAHVVAVSAGATHSLALTADGRVWAWGSNGFGELGNGSADGRLVAHPAPAVVAGLSNVIAIAAGNERSLALLSDSTVVEWGRLPESLSVVDTVTVPRPVTGLSHVVEIASGWGVDVALEADESVWTWGVTLQRALDPNTDPADDGIQVRPAPQRIAIAAQFTDVSIGSYGETVVGVEESGTSYGWGYDNCNQASLPVSPLTRVSAGVGHVLGLRADNTVVAWGCNQSGQLGNGTREASATFGEVRGLTGVTAIAAGFEASVAVKSDGTVWTWGSNATGQLGNGSLGGSEPTPAQVPGVIVRH